MTSSAALIPLLTAGADAAANAAGPSDAYLVAALVLGGIGLFLLAVEVFIPTGGLLALLCGTCFVASVVAMFMWSPTGGLVLLLVYTIAAPFLLMGLLKLWSTSPIAKRLSLNEGTAKSVVEEAPPDIDPNDPDAQQSASDAARRRRILALNEYVGRNGVSETALRPSGFVSLDGRRVDAVAEAGCIDSGVPVRLVAFLDGGLRVRAEA